MYFNKLVLQSEIYAVQSHAYKPMFTSRIHGALLAILISFIAADASAQVVPKSAGAPSPSTPESASLHNTQVVLTVSDGMGNPVPAPSKDLVQVRVGGQPVELEELRPLKDAPLFFSVLMDVSGSSRQFASQQSAATSRLFADLSIGNNRGYLIFFTSKIVTNDRSLSASAVDEILRRFATQARSGSTALYDAIIHAASQQLSSTKIPKDSRRAIFVLSDGADNTSRTNLADTVEAVQKEDIPIFSIGFSRSDDPDHPRTAARERKALKTLSDNTGGLVTFLDDREDPVGRIANLTAAQCLLSFKTPALKPRKSYPLKIESSTKGTHFLAPKEFFVQ